VTRDSDSQRPLMSDDEDELCEEYSSIQQQEEEPEPQPKAIGFLQAFCLPGVLPVCVHLYTSLLILIHYCRLDLYLLSVSCSIPWLMHV